jgi:polyisoprenoid-binding protein YceI
METQTKAVEPMTFSDKTTWVLDPAHSEVKFKVKHLMITTISGQFKKFDVEAITHGDDFSNVIKIEFTADVDSISTGNEQRDTHLKSDDFFNAYDFKQIRFTGLEFKSDKSSKNLYGALTIRDHTEPITLNVEFGGIVVDPYGQTKAGFTVTGSVSRKEFGLMWNAVTEAGSIVVSDEVKFEAEIQLVKQA